MMYLDLPYYAAGSAIEGSWLSTLNEMAWRTIQQQFKRLYTLQDSWDGDDAKAPDVDVLVSVSQLIDALRKSDFPPPNRILPSLEGGVVIEWRWEKRYLEIEIEEPYCGEVMEVQENAPTEHYELCWNQLSSENRSASKNWPESNVYALDQEFTTHNAANMA